MATFSGVSLNGIQSLGLYTASATRWVQVTLPAFGISDYKQRIGLILIRQAGTEPSPRVIDIRKLFATGVLFLPAFPAGVLEYQVAVDWYVSGTPWVCQTAP